MNRIMKVFMIGALLITAAPSFADSFTIIRDGKTYTCEQNSGDDTGDIALLCYDHCRDKGNSHPYCVSVCDAEGVRGVMASCYRRCTADGTSDAYCRSVCD